MKRTGPSNPHLQFLIAELRKLSNEQKVGIWDRIAEDLAMPTRNRRIVNLSRLNRFTKDNEVVIVPGKVLGSGSVDHKVTVAAWDFSGQAKEKIESMKGQCLSIHELIRKNPKGSNVRILG